MLELVHGMDPVVHFENPLEILKTIPNLENLQP